MSFLHLRGLTRWLVTPVDRPAGIQVTHTVAPAEPLASIEARITEVDRRLAVIAEVPAPVREPYLLWQVDRLLDLRNAIRPGRAP